MVGDSTLDARANPPRSKCAEAKATFLTADSTWEKKIKSAAKSEDSSIDADVVFDNVLAYAEKLAVKWHPKLQKKIEQAITSSCIIKFAKAAREHFGVPEDYL